MKSKDDEESEDNNESDCIVIEDDVNNLIDSSTHTLADNKDKIKEATTKKHEDIDTCDKTIMRNTIASMECNSLGNLSDLAISAISVSDSIERSSLEEYKKIKSFLGR